MNCILLNNVILMILPQIISRAPSVIFYNPSFDTSIAPCTEVGITSRRIRRHPLIGAYCVIQRAPPNIDNVQDRLTLHHKGAYCEVRDVHPEYHKARVILDAGFKEMWVDIANLKPR